MEIKDLKPKVKSKKRKRIGRGIGSGKGQKSGRGQDGEKSRAGKLFYHGFEGGNVPFFRKIPKRGFRHRRRISYQCLNIEDLKGKFNAKAEVGPKSLFQKNLVKSPDKPIKLLGRGDIDVAISIKVNKFSQRAKEKIEKAGGSVECLTR